MSEEHDSTQEHAPDQDMPVVRNVTVNLGPWLIRVHGQDLGTCDNLALSIEEATFEELATLQSASVITLLKVRP